MTEHQVLCVKCGNHDFSYFSYDSFWEEYTCRKCGWVVNDNEKISALSKIRNNELKRKQDRLRDRLKEPKAVEVKRDGRFIAFEWGC